MSISDQTYLTQDGLDKLHSELKELKTVRRKEIAHRIQEAKELGDLSENAEYTEAKTEQGFIEGRIIEIENILKNALVIENNKSNTEVHIGSTIEVEYQGKIIKYTIVGYNEANPAAGLISNESPIGQALLGHKMGDNVDVSLPRGTVNYKIKSIS